MGLIALQEHFVTPELEDVIGAVGWDPAGRQKVIARPAYTDGRRLEETSPCVPPVPSAEPAPSAVSP
jgi:hypothetical protein